MTFEELLKKYGLESFQGDFSNHKAQYPFVCLSLSRTSNSQVKSVKSSWLLFSWEYEISADNKQLKIHHLRLKSESHKDKVIPFIRSVVAWHKQHNIFVGKNRTKLEDLLVSDKQLYKDMLNCLKSEEVG